MILHVIDKPSLSFLLEAREIIHMKVRLCREEGLEDKIKQFSPPYDGVVFNSFTSIIVIRFNVSQGTVLPV